MVALILTFGAISGAHFNPAVSVSDALVGGLSKREAVLYVISQCGGGLLGTAVAHLMFSAPLYSVSQHSRSGSAQVFSEFVAAFGLMAVIWGCSKTRASMVPFAVGALHHRCVLVHCFDLIRQSGSNARACIQQYVRRNRPHNARAFVIAQFAGALAATGLFRWLLPRDLAREAPRVLVPHPTETRGADMRTYIFAQ